MNLIDKYALRKALAGVDHSHLKIDQSTAILINLIRLYGIAWDKLDQLIPDPQLRAEIFSLDAHGEPSTEPDTFSLFPQLPASAQLTAEQSALAATTGGWLKEYVAWAGGVANQTPLNFHLAAGLWLMSLVIGRRCHLYVPWGGKTYPHLYIMSIAPSTYYRKSTGMKIAADIARDHLPHLLMPNPGSQESFISILAGHPPKNMDNLLPYESKRILDSQPFAGQQGLVRDEIAGLFKSMSGKDYMAGLKDDILAMYDAPSEHPFYTQSKGLVTVRNVAMSIIGSTTPSELAISISSEDWTNGLLARFILLAPEENYTERERTYQPEFPSSLLQHWRAVFHALPKPPDRTSDKQPEDWSLIVEDGFWDEVIVYETALRNLTHPTSGLDDRLKANYGRMHTLGIKLAIDFAVFDWVQQGKPTLRPRVSLAHWYLARQYTESWRESLHSILTDLVKTKEVRLEEQILRILQARAHAGLTARDLYRSIGSNQKLTTEALNSLIADGQARSEQGHRSGNLVTLYYPVKEKDHV